MHQAIRNEKTRTGSEWFEQRLINELTGEVGFSADCCHKLAIKTAFPIAYIA